MTVRETIFRAVHADPGIGVAGLSTICSMDKGNVRRFALELERAGKLSARKDRDGYRFFPAGAASAPRSPRDAPEGLAPRSPARECEVVVPKRTDEGRLSGPSHALVPVGGEEVPKRDYGPLGRAEGQRGQVVHRTPNTPISRLPTHPPSRSSGFAAVITQTLDKMFQFDPDGTLTERAMARHEQDAQADEAGRRERRLIEALNAERAARADDQKHRDAAEFQATLLSFASGRSGRFEAATGERSAPKPSSEKPKSLLQEAREERAARLAEAETVQHEHFRESVRAQMKRWPVDEFPELYSHLDEEDLPEPRTTVTNIEKRIPNGAAPSHAAPLPEPAPSTPGLPLSTQFGIVAAVVAAVALMTKFAAGGLSSS